jgi:hypothetical protein
MRKAWIIYNFEKNGESPHIWVVGIVTSEKDMNAALKQNEGSWSVPTHYLSWSPDPLSEALNSGDGSYRP